jgi:acetoacetyl-CoA synthetase
MSNAAGAATFRRDAGGVMLADFLAPYAAERKVRFERLPFDHPLYIMYSSGTTGVPKCIVHCAGGTLLQHLKEHQLHSDVQRRPPVLLHHLRLDDVELAGVRPGRRRHPAALRRLALRRPRRILFDYAEAEGMTHFGTSAKFIDAIAKIDLQAARDAQAAALRAMLSTGSPLVPESFDYVYANIKQDVLLASISGGTDIVSCFVLGNPNGCRCGAARSSAPAWAWRSRCSTTTAGRCAARRANWCAPGPSRDAGRLLERRRRREVSRRLFRALRQCLVPRRLRELTEHGGFIIYGRSDATLNPGGVRIGTAEIYRQVEKLAEVVESIVIGQDWPPGSRRRARGAVRQAARGPGAGRRAGGSASSR